MICGDPQAGRSVPGLELLRRLIQLALLVGVPLVAAYQFQLTQWMEQQRDAWIPVAHAEAKQTPDEAGAKSGAQDRASTPTPPLASPPLRRPSGHVFIATSLDGFISRPDGDIEWLLSRDQSGEDHGYDDFIRDIDGILMGRGTFEKVAAFDPWPYTKPVVVMSKSLVNTPLPPQLEGRVRVLNLSPQTALDHLSREGWKRVYIDGGQLIQSCLREGLIDDFVITTVPVLIGEGRPLFGPIQKPELSLTHVHTKAFPSGLVQSVYRVQPSDGITTRA